MLFYLKYQYFYVSIPYRYSKIIPVLSMVSAISEFQFLIGILKSKQTKGNIGQ